MSNQDYHKQCRGTRASVGRERIKRALRDKVARRTKPVAIEPVSKRAGYTDRDACMYLEFDPLAPEAA